MKSMCASLAVLLLPLSTHAQRANPIGMQMTRDTMSYAGPSVIATTGRTVAAFVGSAVGAMWGQAFAQSRSLSTEIEVAQDAISRFLTRMPNLRVDEQSSRAAILQLQVAMGATSRNLTGRLFPTIAFEPTDSVVRCASRSERGAHWCASVSPRNVVHLYRATRNEDSTVVMWVQAIQWEKPRTTHPSAAVWKYQYRRASVGSWRFEKELNGIAS